jgi:hypothetical protein
MKNENEIVSPIQNKIRISFDFPVSSKHLEKGHVLHGVFVIEHADNEQTLQVVCTCGDVVYNSLREGATCETDIEVIK